MPLNLLKHKSWNVYSEKNVERVRRDEELARISDGQLAKRDSENKLRRLRGLTELPDFMPGPKGKFANFWEQEEKREHDRQELYRKHGHEIEVMKEKHGLGPLPWYMQQNSESTENSTSTTIKRSVRDDPMSLVNSLLTEKNGFDEKNKKEKAYKRKERHKSKRSSPKEHGSLSHKHGISKRRRHHET
ncbi:leukocyte receptor 1-like protein [Schizosaccharomyces osmophilus]|uniref:Leukocyte receptor 1-like protein n=1 Tax=Schizosaccharomyces osmophilus TaxID=2545709 RepID=A0AAE9WFU5_9SCHI|nr:leukocyte receptor 1-like protein [Schizosaccharomyces osmophilus]WBW75420.1 leukocyte receptor 1-like protein [Schizosaccharomyces osmophilus]